MSGREPIERGKSSFFDVNKLDTKPVNQKDSSKGDKAMKESSDDKTKPQVGTSKGETPKAGASPVSSNIKANAKDITKKSKREGSPTIADSNESLGKFKTGYCSKCVEKGRTCISECPRVKKQ